ncbi:hypothetical protein BB561_006243 [Smittium simulii]|uniref:Uncharacterized protein n=1 Tax=Smittium simulii TaxID=133385 RepID=A0A2T9Y5K7_9FUNG|nr:hypothetical protein BB561_006243 [Smittium simulii]
MRDLPNDELAKKLKKSKNTLFTENNGLIYRKSKIYVLQNSKLDILGPTNSLSTKELTAKPCWLIAVCGLLRAGNIHRVDNEKTEISSNSIKLFICAPKEKRKSSQIKRLVEIKAHSDEIICPVFAYKIYNQRIANIPCPKSHVNDKNLIVNNLFKNNIDFRKPVTVDSISRKIK